MQTLGLADSTPHTENRLKSLFWPAIKTGADVDYLGAQGYWVCSIIAVVSLLTLLMARAPVIAVLMFLYYYLGGVGVRQRSIYAASVVFVLYFLDTVVAGASIYSGMFVLRLLLTALLLSNLRATILSASWRPDSEDAALPPRLSDTWGDKLGDQFPAWLWPKVRVPYYIFSALMIVLIDIGLAVRVARQAF